MKGEDETKVEDTPRAIAEKMSDEAIEEVAEMQGELGNTTSAALIRDYVRLRRLMKARDEGAFNAARFDNAKDAIDTFHIESRCEEPQRCHECEWHDSRLGRWCFAKWLYTRKGENGKRT